MLALTLSTAILHFIFTRNKIGSTNAVKKPTAEKQTRATDTLAYLIEP